jgi:hypothetical protein
MDAQYIKVRPKCRYHNTTLDVVGDRDLVLEGPTVEGEFHIGDTSELACPKSVEGDSYEEMEKCQDSWYWEVEVIE